MSVSRYRARIAVDCCDLGHAALATLVYAGSTRVGRLSARAHLEDAISLPMGETGKPEYGWPPSP